MTNYLPIVAWIFAVLFLGAIIGGGVKTDTLLPRGSVLAGGR